MRSKLAHYRLWLGFGWLLLLTIVVLTLIPPPDRLPSFEFEDKIGHMFAYAVLTLWFAQLYASQRFAYAIAFVALGIALEFCQGALGYRSFEYGDMVANALGVVFGALLAMNGRFHFLSAMDRALVRAGT